ncbi:MAG: type II toxin-antitoxin system VapC family toxin [Mycobacteriales bacterium]
MTDEGLLDTSVVIHLEQLDPADLPLTGSISMVTLAELSAGPDSTLDPGERAVRQVRLQNAEADFDPLPFDKAAARAFGQVSSSLRASGRKTSARAFDALIAATALSRGLPLFTVNPRDFTGIDGLDVVAVPHPHAG